MAALLQSGSGLGGFPTRRTERSGGLVRRVNGRLGPDSPPQSRHDSPSQVEGNPGREMAIAT